MAELQAPEGIASRNLFSDHIWNRIELRAFHAVPLRPAVLLTRLSVDDVVWAEVLAEGPAANAVQVARLDNHEDRIDLVPELPGLDVTGSRLADDDVRCRSESPWHAPAGSMPPPVQASAPRWKLRPVLRRRPEDGAPGEGAAAAAAAARLEAPGADAGSQSGGAPGAAQTPMDAALGAWGSDPSLGRP